jgi:hypothetical protein
MILPPPFEYAGSHKVRWTQANLIRKQEGTMTATLSKKSGKGITDGVISELSAFFGVKPGHEEELRTLG